MENAQHLVHDFAPTRALIVGLAREGTALARFLAERGARVTVTDIKAVEALADNMEALSDLPVTFALGGHPLVLLDDADIVFVSPGVPLDIPLLVEARRRRLPLSSETRLFTRLCPARIVGITGSSGKTTTTALVGEMLRAAGYRTWIGGNIGRPLISHLVEIAPGDTVVMELSSFQLEFFGRWSDARRGKEETLIQDNILFDPVGWSPPIAAVLNITPNHLDRHPTMEAYITAKSNILVHQGADDLVVLNADNAFTRKLGEEHRAQQQVLWFSLEQRTGQGAFLRGDELVLERGGREETVCRSGDLKLMGRHNVANALAACALAGAASAPVGALRQAAISFGGVEHRLEFVRERDGVRWYNDSIATSPERTVAALRAFNSPVVLLAGGRDKYLPWDEMAGQTWRKARHLILFGEAAKLIERAMLDAQSAAYHAQRADCQIHHAGALEQAVEVAAQLAQPGDVVLLSPGGTSFDAYRDYEARGEHFRQLVNDLE